MNKTELALLKGMSVCKDGYTWLESQDTLAIAWEKCDKGDWLLWYGKRKQLLTKEQAVNIAILCAERVLPIYEKKNPGKNKPRKAIELAKAWLLNPCEETSLAAYAAAADSAAAAAADSAAYAAAADSAAAAAAYAYAAAYAAAYDYAYAYAAYDYAYAYAAERKAQADIIRSIVTNPFLK